jgi:hypothetical protein
VLAIGLVAGAAGSAGASDFLVRDGNFEYPKLPAGGAGSFSKGDTFGAWSVTRGTAQLFTAVPGQAKPRQGAQFLALNGLPTGNGAKICQNLPGLIEGGDYTLSLAAASLNPISSSTDYSTFDVRINDIRIGFLDLNAALPAKWTHASFGFGANLPHEKLCIEGIGSSTFTFPLIDALSIKRVES